MSEQAAPSPASSAPRTFTPAVLAWLGALGAAIAPTMQFINGYWETQLKQTELAHQVALDFAKMAIADNASREYRRDTLKVIATIKGNPLQEWANAELAVRRGEQQEILEAMRSRHLGRRYLTLPECRAHYEQQVRLGSYIVAETLDRKNVKEASAAAVKDDYTLAVERDCQELATGGRALAPGLIVAAAVVLAPTAPRPTAPSKPSNAAQSASAPPPTSAASPQAGSATTQTSTNSPQANDRACASQNSGANALDRLTAFKLAQIFPKARPADIDLYLPVLRKGLAKADMTSCARVAMFLAQVGHESSDLRFLEEFGSGDAYEGRADLGNTEPGDGPRFKGRGLFGVVGRANYQRLAETFGRPDLMTTPTLLATDPDLALQSALWFWNRRNLNVKADSEDLIAVTRGINGGTNGLESRRKHLDAALSVL